MSFIQPDEFVILMDVAMLTGRMFSVDELRGFYNAGVRTAYWAGPEWNGFSQKDREYDWSYFDNYLKRLRQARLKAIIPLWHQQSTLQPSSYYARDVGGRVVNGVFSPWNMHAQEKNLDMIRRVIEHYKNDGDVLFVNGQCQGGERVLMNRPAYYDDAALQAWGMWADGDPDHTTPEGAEWLRLSYLTMLHNQMELFVDQPTREIWYALSRYKATGKNPIISCHGCEWIDDYLEDWQSLKPSKVTHINFNYFPYGDEFIPIIEAERERWGVDEIVGAEYCEGLKADNGRKAIKRGMRVIVGPCHAFTGHDKAKDWMFAEIARNVNLYRTHPELRYEYAR